MAQAPFNKNGLVDLAPDLYIAVDYVLRELTGAIPSVTLDARPARGTIGQVTRSFVSPKQTTRQITPAMTPPDLGAQNYTNREVKLENHAVADIIWNGEEQREMATNGVGMNPMVQASIQQSVRKLANDIEAYTCTKLSDGAGAGLEASAGSGLLFDNNIDDSANALKHFLDNGVPTGALSMVIDTETGRNLRVQEQLTKANEAADSSLLRQGILGSLHSFDFRESAQINQHTAGTAAGATVAGAQAAEDTTITLAAAGTGSILAGDLIKIGSHEYGVVTGLADVSAGGTIEIEEPGLKEALVGGEAADPVASGARNIALDRGAFLLSTRAPAAPANGDMATDTMMITDPRTGLTMEVREYKGYYQNKLEIGIAYGGAVMKPEAVLALHNA